MWDRNQRSNEDFNLQKYQIWELEAENLFWYQVSVRYLLAPSGDIEEAMGYTDLGLRVVRKCDINLDFNSL